MFYARVKLSSQRSSKPVGLPFSIGNSAQNRVIVNINGMRPCWKIVDVQENRLVLIDTDTGKSSPLSSLDAFGMSIKGPYELKRLSGRSLRRWFHEKATDEKLWFKNINQFWSRWLDANLKQAERWLLIVALTLIAIVSVSFIRNLYSPKPYEDLAQRPIVIQLGETDTHQYGSNSSFYGFARGMTFKATIPQVMQAQDLALSLQTMGLDVDGELVIAIDEYKLYSSSIDSQCLTRWCDIKIRLPKEVLKGREQLTVRLIHAPFQSDYFIRQISISAPRALQPVELQTVQRWLAVAERQYNERFISHRNLAEAQHLLQKTLQMLGSSLSHPELLTKAQALKSEVEKAKEEIKAKLRFSAVKNKELGQLELAVKNLNDVLDLVEPDAFEEKDQIQSEIKRLKDLQ